MEIAQPDPTSIDAAVFGAYGARMLTVQAFERNLATLVLVAGQCADATLAALGKLAARDNWLHRRPAQARLLSHRRGRNP